MQRIHNVVRGDVRAWALLLTVLILCLCAAISGAQSVPNVVMSQVSLMAGFGSGGALTGGAPSGSSMAVDANGNVIVSSTYGKAILEFAPGASAPTMLGSFKNFNPGGVAIDLPVPRQQVAWRVRVPAQRRGERAKWQAAAAEVHAAAVQHLGLYVSGEVPDQSGLADPGLAADQHRGR